MKKRQKKRHKRGKQRKSKYSNLNTSKMSAHKRTGSKLQPPLRQLDAMTTSSWADDHMPEMLWAALIAEVFDRKTYIDCFRKILVEFREHFLPKDIPDEANLDTEDKDETAGLNFTTCLDLTTLAELPDEDFQRFVDIVVSHPLGYAALRPLLMLDSIPGIDRWRQVLAIEPTDDDWQTLARAVAGVMDHQSERSTDIRWFKFMLPAICGRVHFPQSWEERLEEMRLFPNKGDMRSVRPSIRAAEMTLRRYPHSEWIEKFWAETHDKTGCIDPVEDGEEPITETRIDPKTLYTCRGEVIQRFFENISSKRADARLDSSFGMVLYALALIEEIGFHRVHKRILGRLGLRALVEANITLRYLTKKDDDKLWKTHRVYGAGQAKLAFLKAQQLEKDLPTFIDEDALYQIANEDIWQEFLDIDIGHWARSNLRKLATDSGAKDLYDRYYDWASAFVHAQWGAVRDTNFVTCHNPLHRFHRIPRLGHRRLSSVEADVIALVNEMLTFLEELYPGSETNCRLELTIDTHDEDAPSDSDPETAAAD